MADVACVAFLQWALPMLHLRWAGFRHVRRQVCRRIDRRRAELGLPDLAAYRAHLETHAEEWATLAELCRVTISRFARDRAVWDQLVAEALPALARAAEAEGRATLRVWSAGCGAGEEPYTLAVAWALAVAPRHPGLALEVLATDIDDGQLGRARTACYPTAALRELPEAWRRAAFDERDEEACLREPFRGSVRFVRHDLRTPPPAPGPFDLILCRNLAFSYFDEPLQRAVAATFHAALRPGGVLVVGGHEALPHGTPGFAPAGRCLLRAQPLT